MTNKYLSDKLSFTIESKLREVSDNIETLLTDLWNVEKGFKARGKENEHLDKIVSTLEEANEAVCNTLENVSDSISTADIEKAVGVVLLFDVD